MTGTENELLYDLIREYSYNAVWKHIKDPAVAEQIADEIRLTSYAGLSPHITNRALDGSIDWLREFHPELVPDNPLHPVTDAPDADRQIQIIKAHYQRRCETLTRARDAAVAELAALRALEAS